MDKNNLDYNSFVEIADGTYWVGFADDTVGLHCNAYLIVDHDEAVVIDSGSRGDFSTVMTKIMRTGTNPSSIIRLIYQHYDPDLCGNMPHMEALINNDRLKILSHRDNNQYIRYYSVHSPKECIEDLDFMFGFRSGRRLAFIPTPYAHAPGSFVTYDMKTKVLFSSDIFGGYDADWELYAAFQDACSYCEVAAICPLTGKPCPVHGVLLFHQRMMSSEKALRFALTRIQKLDISLIAPQHGSLLHTPSSQKMMIDRLSALQHIGINHYLETRTKE